ncbi:mutarotase [Flavobacterium aquidurense]|uniref:Cyclic phosphodiesterase-like protein n=1 Tax=Flavobacterium aquidurense TaxID=362413 RepID=A0A0Q1BG53_9FLAO|nr:mutarotase [Flavobacterium aquidurense]KQB39565.1 Cyclic phosphodiesterase-like protein [Flavobacterium aquidurense]
MDLITHYDQLYNTSSKAILEENYKLDTQIKDTSDSRFGITLLMRPNETIKAKIQLFLEELKTIEPEQYYYPDSDLHITVLSIISCYDGFTLDKIQVKDYISVIQQSLVHLDKINIEFRGITASPSAVMIQGFPTDESLNNFRDKLRENFKKSDLEQSIDSRYTIAAAHSTVMRFQEKLQNPEKLIEITEKFRDYDFGELKVKNLELVYNNWYQREENTIHLADFII